MNILSHELLPLFIAAVSGITMAMQGTLNSAQGKIIGLWETTFIVHLVGTVLMTILIFGFRLGHFKLSLWVSAPWYTYLGGVLSVVIIYLVAHSIPQVGVAPATTAIILGQVFAAALIDYLGLFGMEKIPFNWCRIAGPFLMAGGAWLMLKK